MLFQKGHKFSKGNKIGSNTRFKKGRTPWNKDKLWSKRIAGLKKQAKVRDDYTCQICGLRDPEIMEVDHIKPTYFYPKLFKILENLITICPNCHRRKTNRELRSYNLGLSNEERRIKSAFKMK